ncbi:deoxyribodipyrimidine photolyase [Desulfosoma sp.]|uniref:deoxyribodipyrimidine photolyase n=1 Tax=Desulfosoma sp. TaxID=2603217 RepID=UPI00404A5130
MSAFRVPQDRIQAVNPCAANPQGDFVLYWMTAYRRLSWNFALDRAVQWALELQKPLVILEALRADYPWASDRFHGFILQGMRENEALSRSTPATYYGYVERASGEGKGLLSALGQRACVVVTDDFPAFFLPSMIEAAARKLSVLLEKVDSNGLLPMNSPGKVFLTAHSFRRYLQQTLRDFLEHRPLENPLDRLPPLHSAPNLENLFHRWPPCTAKDLERPDDLASALPIDHRVNACSIRGGSTPARRRLEHFIARHLSRYAQDRNQPDEDVTSGLSPYLHFGHLSAHEIFDAVGRHEAWSLEKLALKATGSRAGWWGMSEGAEAFLDQLVTWRELGFNMCRYTADYDAYESLPAWARETLKRHTSDTRPYVYALEELEQAETHDPLWNAAQTQLVLEGRIHNYLRMLWGKKILHWSRSPQEALQLMIELNNKYALDGRDPNSYTGIFWVLGRYDRPWGPERPVFGKVRYMSSKNTARKIRLEEYLSRYGKT